VRHYRFMSITWICTKPRGRSWEDTVLSLLDRNLGQNHHMYLDNFYDSVNVAETLLDRK
jgi:hypothetical protein